MEVEDVLKAIDEGYKNYIEGKEKDKNKW
jgi:hypothetical protein